MNMGAAQAERMYKYCVLCQHAFGPHWAKCCTEHFSLVAISTTKITPETKYFFLTGEEIEPSALAGLRDQVENGVPLPGEPTIPEPVPDHDPPDKTDAESPEQQTERAEKATNDSHTLPSWPKSFLLAVPWLVAGSAVFGATYASIVIVVEALRIYWPSLGDYIMKVLSPSWLFGIIALCIIIATMLGSAKVHRTSRVAVCMAVLLPLEGVVAVLCIAWYIWSVGGLGIHAR